MRFVNTILASQTAMITLTVRPIAASGAPIDQYIVDLLFGDYAILTRSNGAWSAVVHPRGEAPRARGLFATPQDAIAVFETEVSIRLISMGANQPRPKMAALDPNDRRGHERHGAPPVPPHGGAPTHRES